ncbi:MAG: energy transducer TonB, partial [Gammaproteobacteria bacterium]
LAANGDDERVQTAQRALFDRLMNRTAEATASADEQAAQAWLVAAESLELDAAAVASARDVLEQRMIQLATARPIPVSDLTLLDYTPPAYPKRALDRNVQGWVDVEFTVTSAGTPTDVSVINASHKRYFKEEAIEAVEEWRFEPRQVRGQLVDQRTFTRLSFKLE